MNELLFFCHIAVLLSVIVIALKLGREALLVAFCLQVLLANLFVTKQISLFTLDVTATDVFTIGSIITLHLIEEYFGKKSSSKALMLMLFTLGLFLVMAKMHLLYMPSSFDVSQSSFRMLLDSTPRIMISSIVVTIAAMRLSLFLLRKGKQIFPNTKVLFISTAALILTQIFDTIAFSYLALYHIVASLFDIILISLLIKTILIFCMNPISVFAKRFMKVSHV